MAKSFLSVPINQIPTTSEVSDDDYIIIESPTKGTRIIRKDDLINSGGIRAGKGVIFEDSSTIGVDFANICSTGLRATEDQLMVNYGLGLSADSSGKLFVNTTQLLSGGAPSSIKYYDAAGLSAIHTANVSGTVKHLYWTGSGVLSSIQLTTLGVPTIDSYGNPILVSLQQLSVPRILTLNSTYSGILSIAPSDTFVADTNGTTLTISDSVGRWNSSPNYNNWGNDSNDIPLTITVGGGGGKLNNRIILPEGQYMFDSGYYYLYSATDYGMQARLRRYDGSTNTVYSSDAEIAVSPRYDYPWDKVYPFMLMNVAPIGVFSVTPEQAARNDYLQLDFTGFSQYQIFRVGTTDTCVGFIKIIKVL
jgi:hypothetical protein